MVFPTTAKPAAVFLLVLLYNAASPATGGSDGDGGSNSNNIEGGSPDKGRDSLVVRTRGGRVRGVSEVAANGKEVHMWWGIPFAQPPVGDLRFRAPRPAKKWSSVLEARRKPNSCVQIRDMMFPGFPGAEMWNPNTPTREDCLYLNVAVPVPRPNNTAVMVWIYGGSFYSGTSTLDVYDPKVLASEQGVVVVSLQYRLGSLGFLYAAGEGGVDGNAGLLDQRMAIRWVRDNIAAFGGNPLNITLFSESAGSSSVAFHMLSPGSQHLFQQSILQSAAATNPWAMVTPNEGLLRARRLAEVVKCPSEEGELSYMVDCLRSVNATRLVNAEWEGIVFGIMGCPFTPVLDGEFFRESPSKALKRGNFKKANVLLGTNRNEGNYFLLYYLTDIYKNQENVSMSKAEFRRSVKEVNLFVNPVGRHAIEYEYTPWLTPENTTALMLAVDKMVGDYQFTCPTIEFADYYSEVKGVNVYQYYFDHRASNAPWPEWTGAMHGDEIAFIFGEPLNESMGYTQQEKDFSRQIMTFWGNFAKTGSPSLFPNGSWTLYWPLRSAIHREYFVLSPNNMTQGKGLNARKCAFWLEYLPRLQGSNEPTQECSSDHCANQCRKRAASEASGSSSSSSAGAVIVSLLATAAVASAVGAIS